MNGRERRRYRANHARWDESVAHHVASPDYDVPGFLRGADPLFPLEVDGMGPVRGRTLLHLQCHFGLDTLAWARRGARVVGLDYSAPAVAAARALAARAGLTARFVRSDVLDAPRRLGERFDLVYTGKGALCWLPDLEPWADAVARLLRPGGRLFYLEDHPIAEDYEPTGRGGRLVRRHDYFRSAPLRFDETDTYATRGARLRHTVGYCWLHPTSQAVTALAHAGLVIDEFREYPFSYWHRYPAMRRAADGYWHLPREGPPIPLTYSVRAHRPLRGRD